MLVLELAPNDDHAVLIASRELSRADFDDVPDGSSVTFERAAFKHFEVLEKIDSERVIAWLVCVFELGFLLLLYFLHDYLLFLSFVKNTWIALAEVFVFVGVRAS